MRSTFKVLFYVKKGSEKPNGNLPLMCRITVDGEIKQFSCKMDVPPRLWDVKNSRASGKSVEAQRINLAVDKIRVEVNHRYQELMQTDGYVTAAKLKDAYLGIGVKQETLLKLFEQHNAEFEKKVGHSRAQGTFTRYRTVCNHIREFLPHTYKREDIPLKELNLTFINDFEYFLRTEKKCRTNTVWGYMIVLKHIVSIARNDGRLPFNPFAGYINSPESVDRGNQVRAIRINVSGTHEDMKRIEEEGRLDEWCADNLKYFADTFGKENIVAAHLHRDEETPHIHVTLVPIVKGERKRRKREEQTKKRYRKKPTDTVRLCADDIMTRLKLKSYQDTYAVAMAKYGLQRGIDGSKARHKST